jgi:hypothetical protein
MKTIFMALALTTLIASATTAAQFRFQSGVKQVSLLELYTSEGCSSCPPAEDWLNRLKDSPGLWKNFVPLAFHVDYWNSLGWKDRWSAPEFSERQRGYAQLWRAENIYTPCFVLNGAEWHGWLGRREPSASGGDVGVLEVKSAATNRWTATFVPANPVPGNFEIHAALLAGALDSNVRAGENNGRSLRHEFAVLDLVSIGMTTGNGIAHGKFILDTSRYASEKLLALAVWITRPGELTPLQATGGWRCQQALEVRWWTFSWLDCADIPIIDKAANLPSFQENGTYIIALAPSAHLNWCQFVKFVSKTPRSPRLCVEFRSPAVGLKLNLDAAAK